MKNRARRVPKSQQFRFLPLSSLILLSFHQLLSSLSQVRKSTLSLVLLHQILISIQTLTHFLNLGSVCSSAEGIYDQLMMDGDWVPFG
ncbi:hypothetical protein VNO80_04559 [Phaseolus coccineus]|uniref:Uncharacterized protein n=1 Tax=Phaseolus coccineus TaxID=3886 RepID=A0AAN9NU01_PHACN